MAGKNVSQLTPVDSLTGTELMYVSQGGVDKSATPDDIVALVPGGGGSSGTLGLVQFSDGAGGFDSDAGVRVGSGVLTADDGLVTGDSSFTISESSPGVLQLGGTGLTATMNVPFTPTTITGDASLGMILQADISGAAALNLSPSGPLASTLAGGPSSLLVTPGQASLTSSDDGINTVFVLAFTASGGNYLQLKALIVKPDMPNMNDFGGPGDEWKSGYFGTSVETVALNATGNVDAATFSVASAPGIDGTITTADGEYAFTKGLLTAFTPT